MEDCMAQNASYRSCQGNALCGKRNMLDFGGEFFQVKLHNSLNSEKYIDYFSFSRGCTIGQGMPSYKSEGLYLQRALSLVRDTELPINVEKYDRCVQPWEREGDFWDWAAVSHLRDLQEVTPGLVCLYSMNGVQVFEHFQYIRFYYFVSF